MIAILQNNASFDKILHSDKPVLVEFTAAWCGPCKTMGPVVDQFAKDFQEMIDVVKVDVDHNADLARAYRVQSVPTSILFYEGTELKRLVGAVNKQALADFVLEEVY